MLIGLLLVMPKTHPLLTKISLELSCGSVWDDLGMRWSGDDRRTQEKKAEEEKRKEITRERPRETGEEEGPHCSIPVQLNVSKYFGSYFPWPFIISLPSLYHLDFLPYLFFKRAAPLLKMRFCELCVCNKSQAPV